MTIATDTLFHYKVKDLQRELKKRGLDTSGLKAVLYERLQEQLEQVGDNKEFDEEKGLEMQKQMMIQETKEREEEERQEKEEEERKEEVERQEDVLDKDEVEQEKKQTDEKEEDMKEEKTVVVGIKRPAEAIENQDERLDAKRAKGTEETTETTRSQPEDQEDNDKSLSSCDNVEASDKTEGDTTTNMDNEKKCTIRIDNFVRPFTLNAVKELVQTFGCFVEEGFWMDAIKTHCFVTYPSSEIAEKASVALDGKVWPPENGRSLSVKLVDCTAMEVSQLGEANIPSQPSSKSNSGAQVTQRPEVTIDEFFQKTETKPVLYYLPLTDEQIEQKKERRGQKPERQFRKRRHRGGRKRNRRARF